MAQEFLNQLLRIENTVSKDEQEARDCMVCLERGNHMHCHMASREQQLPCLPDNVFPAQPRPYLEYGIMDNHDEVMNTFDSATRTSAQQMQSFFEHQDMNDLRSTRTGRMEGWDETDPVDMCAWLCEELELDPQVMVIAESITIPLSQRLQGEAHSPECNAAISVYIAWHLSNQGHNVSNFLTSISRISVGQDYIRSTWASLYENRMELILPEMIPTLARGQIEGILDFLPVPGFQGGIVSGEENGRDSQVGDQRDNNMMTSVGTIDQEADNFAEIDRRLHEVVRNEDLLEDVKHISELMTADMLYQADVEGWSAALEEYSDSVCQAMCVFMACRFVGVAISYSDAARVYNTNKRSLRQLYAYVFPRCSGFINPDVTEIMATRDLERILGALPAL